MDDSAISDHVAVVGMACRFPGAPDLAAFWELLREGRDGISHFTDDELLKAGVPQTELDQPGYVRAYGYLDDLESFDAAFFGYTPREAQMMDPQQRIFLECAWSAIEHAGYDPLGFDVPVGVFAGGGQNSYRLQNLAGQDKLLHESGKVQYAIGNDRDFIATRAAYKLNLRGPSFTVQTACSTSLVAAHLAAQSLAGGECDLALAGGVSVVATRKEGYQYIEEGIFSPDGKTRAFDAAAKGTVGADGVGVIVLKRLEDALEDGDTVYAVLLGSAINNDGSGKVGFTAPSLTGQARVILEAQLVAGVEPEEVSFIEAHGTGTALGDPIEVQALTQVFRRKTQEVGFCHLGAVKSNIGHTGAAAGAAGLIKACLALHNKEIPPSLHFETPNPELNLERSPFVVNPSTQPWETSGRKRIAGVSGFGIGGTNAHLVLSEGPSPQTRSPSARPLLFSISARSEKQVRRLAGSLISGLRQDQGPDLPAASFTLNTGRHNLPVRAFAVASSPKTLQKKLESARTTTLDGPAPKLALLFPGFGGLDVGSGKDLYRSEEPYRKALDACIEGTRLRSGIDLAPYLLPGIENPPARGALLTPEVIHPAHFAVGYAGAMLLLSCGVRPDAVLGHSMGEYAAAVIAGVLTLDQAIELVCRRGELIATLPDGAALSVALPPDELAHLLPPGIELSLENGPSASVVSGRRKAILDFQSLLESRGHLTGLIKIPFASHSSVVDPIVPAFKSKAAESGHQVPKIAMMSCTSGDWLKESDLESGAHWVRHLREKVDFWRPATRLLAEGYLLLETGPGSFLTGLVRTLPQVSQPANSIAMMRHPRQIVDDREAFLETLGSLWTFGHSPDWKRLYFPEEMRRVALPTYPFKKQRHWVERKPQEKRVENSGLLKKRPDIADWFYEAVWQRVPVRSPGIRANAQNWLLVGGSPGEQEILAESFRSRGFDSIQVMRGEAFEARGDRLFQVDPMDAGQWARLFCSLGEEKSPIHAVLHLGWDRPGPETPVTVSNWRSLFDEYGSSHLLLADTLVETQPEQSFIYIAATHGAQEVIGNDLIRPAGAFTCGVLKDLPLRHPNCRTLSLDMDPGGHDYTKQAIEQITAAASDLAGSNIYHSVLAMRNGFAWEQHLAAFRPAPGPGPLRQGGTYLVTGGLAGIGLTIAESLATQFQARLALIGRSGLPPRETWPTTSAPKKQLLAIQAVQRMEAAGAQVLPLAADVTNRKQVQDAFNRAEEHFGPIHGVLHSPGLGSTPAQGSAHLTDNISAKVQGTLALLEICEKKKLDFLALNASLTGLLGSAGRADYSAANSFQQALAASAAYKHLPLVAIGWDAWKAAGEAAAGESAGPGTAAGEGNPANLERLQAESLAKIGIDNHEGPMVFLAALASGVRAPLVSTLDLEERRRRQFAPRQNPFAGAQSAHKKDSTDTGGNDWDDYRGDLRTEYIPPGDPIEEKITEIWQSLFGIPAIGIHDGFFELGGHSVLAIQIVNQLGIAFPEHSFSLSDFFDRPDIASLAEKVRLGAPSPRAKAEEQGGSFPAPDPERLDLEDLENLPEADLDRQLRKLLGGDD